MKKILICALAAVSLLATGCKDMLEEEVFGQQTSEEMLSNPDNVAMIVGRAYSEIKWLHDHWTYWGPSTLSADEAVCPVRNADWGDSDYWRSFCTHQWTPNDQPFEKLWYYPNAGGVLCNKILHQLEGKKDAMEPEVYAQYTAELKVLRCYYYYCLFDAFGRIPYVEGYDSENVPQSETWEIWNKLVTMLEAEAPNLPVISDENRAKNYGRCSQGMAYALLARLYLNAESFGVTPQNCGIESIKTSADFYTKCVETCQKIIDSKSYSIEANFFDNFKIFNENSRENIFVIVENGLSKFEEGEVAGAEMQKMRITLLTLPYAFEECYNMIEKPWNGFCAPPDFLAKYEYGVDKRGACDSILGTKNTEQWGWFLGPVYAANGVDTIVQIDKPLEGGKPNKVVITSNVNALENSGNISHNYGARLFKYEVDKTGTYKYCENDFVLFRYADILYMQYEAAYRAGDNTTCAKLLADPEFQKIRTRVGMPAYAALDLDELLDERGREFAWEMIRRRDLIRFDKFCKGSWLFKPAEADNSRNWFPIPRKMIETSGGLWTQNPGYTTDK